MTNKARTYLIRIKAATNVYDLQSVEIAFKQDSSLTWEDIDKLCAASDDKRYSFRHHAETSQIKDTLFKRTKAEMDAYHDMSHKPESWTAEEIGKQRIRFCAVWQVIEEAELVDEYEAWKEANPNA